MGVIAEGIPRGCQGLFTPVSLGYPLSVFNSQINEILKNVRIDFRTPFFELVQNTFVFRTCFASAISVRPHGNMRKFPQKCQKIAGRCYMATLPQTMVDSWYCLDRVIPERISQVS